jgi:hypothetical protein
VAGSFKHYSEPSDYTKRRGISSPEERLSAAGRGRVSMEFVLFYRIFVNVFLTNMR